MSELSWVSFTPRDTVFVRDGRSFDAASDTRARAVHPWPSTLAGALRAALGGEKDAGRVCGPVLACRNGTDDDGAIWQPHFPVPADLVTEVEEDPFTFRLNARESVGASTDLGGTVTRMLHPPEDVDVETLTGWLPRECLTEYLAGRMPGPDGVETAPLGLVADPLWPEPRIGLARDDRSVRTGFLYQATHLRPSESWGFLVGYEPPPEGTRAPTGPVPLGGRGRMADVGPVTGEMWPEHAAPIEGRVLVYVATPAIWATGWSPPLPDGAELIAAAMGEPQPVATASPRRGWREHRALRWAVPGGSVYLLEFADWDWATVWAAAAHGRAYCPEGATEELRYLATAGFGVVLTGVWS